MNKNRVEYFSDGVFAIVITLLVLAIKVPDLHNPTNGELLEALLTVLPSIIIYAVTFFVIAVFWINHHFLFHTFIKSVNRPLNLLNLAFLMFVAFLPYSADVLGHYSKNLPAVLLYGINVFCISLVSMSMVTYIRSSEELFNDEVSQRIVKQSKIRSKINLGCAVLGLAVSFFSIPLAIFLYAFPVVFNIIPGTLNALERLFGFSLD